MNSVKEKVYVAMSGGVDSSLSAALLLERGYDVTGVFIRVWHPPFLKCTWREDRQDAMRVAAHLGIPFKTLDLEEEYKSQVVDYMVSEYKTGRTPNPDVMCNKKIKFGAFFQWAVEEGADMVATGHYARVKRQDSTVHLLAGRDDNKDQSYFLWTVTQEILARTLFPVGEYQKSEVRSMAKERGLITAEKKDSQGVCFLGEVDMKSFLSRYIQQERGGVLDNEGKKIGSHDGAFFYTIGQRHGFTVENKSPYETPYYVVTKDIEANTITVASTPVDLNKHITKEVVLDDTNWIVGEPKTQKSYTARVRYRQPLQSCLYEKAGRILFSEGQQAITPGQSLVLYDGEVCLGGGVITSS